jgi:hypothetical protein
LSFHGVRRARDRAGRNGDDGCTRRYGTLRTTCNGTTGNTHNGTTGNTHNGTTGNTRTGTRKNAANKLKVGFRAPKRSCAAPRSQLRKCSFRSRSNSDKTLLMPHFRHRPRGSVSWVCGSVFLNCAIWEASSPIRCFCVCGAAVSTICPGEKYETPTFPQYRQDGPQSKAIHICLGPY